jgi:hypothetical protein
MNKYKIYVNGEERFMTDEEEIEYERLSKISQENEAKAQAEADAKVAARAAVIAKLGLTADEAAALLG